MFKRYYRNRFREILGSPLEPADGLGDDAVSRASARAGFVLPKALFDYYSVAGRHWINENHNRLRPIKELAWMGNNLVFMDENQNIAFWGIARTTLSESDPAVLQGVNGQPIIWCAEKYRVSRFLMAMWKWTITGQLESPEPEGADA